MKQVIWKGFFRGDSGITTCSKRYPILLNETGIKCRLESYNGFTKGDPLEKLSVKNRDNSFVILHQVPLIDVNADGYYVVTEFEECPREWWPCLIRAKVIMTQSRFSKQIIAKIPGIDKNKIHVVNWPFDRTFKPEGDNLKSKVINEKTGQYLEQYDFVFGSLFEWVVRKVPHLMWQAFIEEFPREKYPRVAFLNKMTIPQQGDPHGFRDWKRYFPKDPRIMVYMERLEDVGDFYRTLDGYVSPTAGEAWGATLSEAMQCGIPTIGSRHSGNLDYMTDKNSYLVETTKWRMIGKNEINHLPMVKEWQRWKLPLVKSIRKAMREIYEIKMSGKDNPKVKESLKIEKKFSDERIKEQLKKALLKHL